MSAFEAIIFGTLRRVNDWGWGRQVINWWVDYDYH